MPTCVKSGKSWTGKNPITGSSHNRLETNPCKRYGHFPLCTGFRTDPWSREDGSRAQGVIGPGKAKQVGGCVQSVPTS